MGKQQDNRRLLIRPSTPLRLTLGVAAVICLVAVHAPAQSFVAPVSRRTGVGYTPSPSNPTVATGQTTETAAARKPARTAVFISTNPMRAVVVLDGKTILSRTPLLLRGVTPGKHRIEIAHQGYLPYFGSITIRDNGPSTVEAGLTPDYFDPRFSAQRAILINGKKADYTNYRYRFPSGDYQIGPDHNALAVNTIFPKQQIMGVVDLATGSLLTVSAILAAQAILGSVGTSSSTSSGGSNYSGYVPVWIAAGVATISDLSLHIQRARYLKAYGATPVAVEQRPSEVQQLYKQAQDRLVSGQLSEAADLYIRIVRSDRDSLYYPRALYRLAKIQSIQGNNLLATTELEIILHKYPLPDLYDKTCKSLADLSYRAGDYQRALSYLDKMVFLDPLFPRSQIDQYRSEIEKKLGRNAS